MTERQCKVVFSESTGRSTGQILQSGEPIAELSFYLGKLHSKEPAFVDSMIRDRYQAWAKVYGAEQIAIEYQD
ncbi:MAG TPA: hypothetical protein VFG11_04155 [Acidobacteriota bacterium]|nr:hypothetical protein [Acidobacteriota bacterium]